MMDRLSLRARLTVWYSLVLLTVLFLFAIAIVWQQGRIGLRRIDRELDDITSTLGNVFHEELEEVSNPEAAAVEAQHTMGAPGRLVGILDADGLPLDAGSDDLKALEPPGRAIEAERVWTVDTWRVRERAVSFGGRTYRLRVAAPLVDALRERREAQDAMWVAIPLALLLAAAGGLWLASVGLRPITVMARRAGQMPLVGSEDLGQSERRDELGQLARAFNGLIARLRQALQTQRQFMADASHELRTPVSIVLSAADVTLSRERRNEVEYREALSIAGTQARRLARLVEDMLVLARADAGGYPLRPVDLYLNELVVECQRTVDVLARERGVAIQISAAGDVPFRGDEDLLRRMLVNVVQNAVQHTPRGGAVHVEVEQGRAALVVRVRDAGTGIPPADRARVFDRFVQLDPARRGEGAGLGLPIARWIAEAHGGTLVLEESGGAGSTFRITLPSESAMSLPHRTVAVLLLVAILSASCSSTTTPAAPAAPSAPAGPVVQIAGSWTGTLESANFQTRTITLTAVQGGNCVDGAWTSATDTWSGAISGYAGTDSYSGQISIQISTENGERCNGVGDASGPVSGDSLRWTSKGFTAVGSCSSALPQTVTVTLHRT